MFFLISEVYRPKTEDVRLMDYRRQLLQNDDSSQRDENLNFNEFQDRLEQSLWPWAYPSPALAPYNPNVMPFGYPCVPNPPLWIPSTCIEPSPIRYSLAPSFQGLDFQHNLPWQQLPQHQGKDLVCPNIDLFSQFWVNSI